MDIYTVARAGAIGFVAGAGLYATCSYVYSRYFKDQGTNSGSNYNAPVSKEPVDPPATPIHTIEPEPSALPITRQPLPSFEDSPAHQDSASFPIASPPEDEWDKRMNPPRREELFEPIHTIEPEPSALPITRQPLPSFEDSPAHQDSAPLPIASPPAPPRPPPLSRPVADPHYTPTKRLALPVIGVSLPVADPPDFSPTTGLSPSPDSRMSE